MIIGLYRQHNDSIGFLGKNGVNGLIRIQQTVNGRRLVEFKAKDRMPFTTSGGFLTAFADGSDYLGLRRSARDHALPYVKCKLNRLVHYRRSVLPSLHLFHLHLTIPRLLELMEQAESLPLEKLSFLKQETDESIAIITTIIVKNKEKNQKAEG